MFNSYSFLKAGTLSQVFFILLYMNYFNQLYITVFSQNIIKGIVVDNNSENLLSNVFVRLKNTIITTKTDINGFFQIKNISNGSYVLEIKFSGFGTQNFPLELSGKTLDLGLIMLYFALTMN